MKELQGFKGTIKEIAIKLDRPVAEVNGFVKTCACIGAAKEVGYAPKPKRGRAAKIYEFL